MKQGYCQSCFFDKHEIMGCCAMKLKWALEEAVFEIPLVGKKLVRDFSKCEWFEPVELEED